MTPPFFGKYTAGYATGYMTIFELNPSYFVLNLYLVIAHKEAVTANSERVHYFINRKETDFAKMNIDSDELEVVIYEE